MLNGSVKTLDCLILQAESKRSALFEEFHQSSFRGYEHLANPKEAMRALLTSAFTRK